MDFSALKGKIFYFFFPLKNILLAIKSWTPFWFRCHLSTKPPCWWWIASEKPHMALISIRLTTFLIANGILKEVWPLAKGGANDFWVVQLLKYQLHIHEVLNFLDGILKWQDNLILDILLFLWIITWQNYRGLGCIIIFELHSSKYDLCCKIWWDNYSGLKLFIMSTGT